MKIKEVPLSEIHWSMQTWNQGNHAYSELSKKLGDTLRYFAKSSVGSNFYQWDTDRIGIWQPINTAPAEVRPLIDQKLGEISEDVHKKLPQNIASHILDVPNEDYIFYRLESDGTVDIIITGWGFNNFKRSNGEVIIGPPKPRAQVNTLAFVIDGERQPARQFALKASWTSAATTTKVTGDDGLYTLEEREENLQLTVTDILTNREFPFTISNENPYHEFDLTEFTALDVQAILDGQPLTGPETVTVDYFGRHYDLTVQNGQGRLEGIVLHEGQPLTARLRDQEKTLNIARSGNQITFEFVTPVVEEPPVVVVPDPTVEVEPPIAEEHHARITVVDANNQPIALAPYAISQGNLVLQGQLDQQGQVGIVTNSFDPAQPVQMHLTLQGQPQEPIIFNLDPAETEYVLQQNAVKSGNRLLEIIIALIMLVGLLKLVMYVFEPAIKAISRSLS